MLLAASGLGFEITVTSPFSVVLQHHYVFLAVSLGLLGFGLGALALRLWKKEPPVAGFSLAASLLMVTAVLAVVRWPGADRLGLYLLLLVLPFTCLGAALGGLYAQFPGRSGLLYATDLSGAALGALLALKALDAFGGITAALVLAVLPAVAGVILAGKRGLAVLAVVAVAAAIRPELNFGAYHNAPPDKTMPHALSAGAQIEATRWDAFARTDLVADPARPDRKMLFTDGGAGSYLFRWDGTPEELRPFRKQMEYIPFALGAPKKVLLIGPGGGLDVLLSLAAGAESITAVEVNRGLVDLVRSESAIYDHPSVEVVVGDGRRFAATTTEKYDLILLNLVYTQAAEARAAALTENYIFTTEALGRFYDLLTDRGALAVVSHSALEASRAMLTGVAALEERGFEPPAALRQSALLMTPETNPTLRKSLFLLRKGAYAGDEAEAILGAAMVYGMQPLHVPGRVEQALSPLITGRQTLKEFLEDSEYNLSPTSDDRPFFFQLDHGIPEALRVLLAVALLLFAFISWLAWGFRVKGTGFGPFWAYFAMLGLGFMLAEIPLIQRAMLLTGSPELAMSLVVTLLLLGGGLGAFLSPRVRFSHYAPLGVAVLLPVTAFLPTGPAVAMLLPLGLLMGMPFPTGIRQAGERRPRDIALFYAVNGGGSVLGAALAAVVAMSGGFRASLLLAAGLYLLTFVISWRR